MNGVCGRDRQGDDEMRKVLTGLILALVAVGGGWAMAQSHFKHTGQHQGHGQAGTGNAALTSRKVKPLSDEQIADLRAAKGMGYALAAELNGYPGPLHVLQFADQLSLTAAQRAEVQAKVESMKREAGVLGEDVIALETELDLLFATRAINPASLNDVTERIGRKQATVRASHLKYHLSKVAALSSEQVDRYNSLRGYLDRRGRQ